jgi:hypothetical protein
MRQKVHQTLAVTGFALGNVSLCSPPGWVDFRWIFLTYRVINTMDSNHLGENLNASHKKALGYPKANTNSRFLILDE